MSAVETIMQAEIERLTADLDHAVEQAAANADEVLRLREERDRLRSGYRLLIDAVVEFCEHLKPVMSPENVAVVDKMRETLRAARKGEA